MQRQLVLFGIMVSLASLVWWYYPTLRDVRDANRLKAKCMELAELGIKDGLTIGESRFYAEDCDRKK